MRAAGVGGGGGSGFIVVRLTAGLWWIFFHLKNISTEMWAECDTKSVMKKIADRKIRVKFR